MNDSPRTVLFVDDEPRVTSAIRRALRKEPLTVLTVQAGGAALDIPHCASLGMDHALRKVQKNAGRLYDLPVVQACMRIVSELSGIVPGKDAKIA